MQEPTVDIPREEILTLQNKKVEKLIREFGVLPPSVQTLQEAIGIIEKGLPFTKSIDFEETEGMISSGRLKTNKDSGNGTEDITYASVVLNKGYGPVAVILSPEVMQRGQFTAFCVDNLSTYIQHRIKEEKLSRAQVMEEYTLTSEELKEMFAYCLASFTDKPPNIYYSIKEIEDKLRFLTFDIGLPYIDTRDIVRIYGKTGHSILTKEQYSSLAKLANTHNIPIEELYLPYTGVSNPHGNEIAERLTKEFLIPDKFKPALKL